MDGAAPDPPRGTLDPGISIDVAFITTLTLRTKLGSWPARLSARTR
jgi:hypothetical protein